MATSSSSQTALYRLYGEDEELLYVGITYDPERRWTNHASSKSWWHLVVRREVEWFNRRAEAEAAERLAVSAERPRFDATHRNGGNWKQTPRVTYVDPREAEIQSHLRALVRQLAPAAALPPMTVLAAQLGTSAITVDAALEEIGHHEPIQRSGKRWRRLGAARPK